MYQQAIRLLPEHYRYWGFLAESYENIEEKSDEVNSTYIQAIDKAEKILTLNDSNYEVSVSLAFYYAKINKRQAAFAILKKLEDKELFSDLLYTMSISYLSLNDQKQALIFLDKAIGKGYDKEMASADENFSVLYNNQLFKELINE